MSLSYRAADTTSQPICSIQPAEKLVYIVLSILLKNEFPSNPCIHLWMDTLNAEYTYNGILFSTRRKEIVTRVTTWMNPENAVLSKVKQSQKDKHYLIPFT